MGLLSLFKNNLPDNEEIIKELHQREMKMERIINKFRLSFLILISILDTVAVFILKEVMPDSRFEIPAVIITIVGGTIITLIFYYTKKPVYRPWLKYIASTFDMLITFGFAFVNVAILDFPLPITKLEFSLMITVIIIFFNTLSILRNNKNIVIYCAILSIIANAILLYFAGGTAMVIIDTTFFIILLSLFNLWSSEHIVKYLIVNNKLNTAYQDIKVANEEILQKNEEITAQRDEIEAQRDVVISQKEHIEQIHKELTDSIHYAERIQKAVLPHNDLLKEAVSEYFILYKPKDIVSGDFYWISHKKNYLIFSVADCTGHGVPGAFMSMLGIASLNEIINLQGIIQPNLVLDELRKMIINAVIQKGEITGNNIENKVKDGMDISFCLYDTTTRILQFAGANNPLWIVRKSKVESQKLKETSIETLSTLGTLSTQVTSKLDKLSTFELYELKGDKMPIALYIDMKPFNNQIAQLSAGDSLYLFSDGFSDQFGGSKGKKFMSKHFKNLLIETQNISMEQQKTLLKHTIEEWIFNGIGTKEQTDDITVMGLKI